MQYLYPSPGTNVFLNGYGNEVSVSNFVGSFGGDITIGGNNDGAQFYINGDIVDDLQTTGYVGNVSVVVAGDIGDDAKFKSSWYLDVEVSGDIGDRLSTEYGLFSSFSVGGGVRKVVDQGGFYTTMDVDGEVTWVTLDGVNNGSYSFGELKALATLNGSYNDLSFDVATNERIKVLGGEDNQVTVGSGSVTFTDSGVNTTASLGDDDDTFIFKTTGETETTYDGGEGFDTVHIDAGNTGTVINLISVERLFVGGAEIVEGVDYTGDFYIAPSGQEINFIPDELFM